MNNEKAIYESLKCLYPDNADYLNNRIKKKINQFNKRQTEPHRTQLEDINGILITYADTLRGSGSPLSVLKDFLLKYIGSAINTIHLLPFFPYSSDDGFSVIDYEQVNSKCGNWEDINELSAHFYLMFDAVVNHISQKSTWFQRFLRSENEYEDFFIVFHDDQRLSQVTRPRTTPLLTKFDTKQGKKLVWTTFSPDQIDLNYKNPKLLLKMIDILLLYVEKGASLIRLDAIGYLWKEIGTCCIHLDQTHEIVKLFRSILSTLNKNALLITETNVPHSENISYYGTGNNEAHMVYNFSLPPLVLNAYLQHSSKELTHWINGLEDPGSEATYFNFLASHDGIGLMPLKDIVDTEKVELMVKKCLENHGRISYKQNEDGSQTPYELNINYFDALADSTLSQEYQVRKFLGAYSIAIALKGIPGIYIHSLLGSKNWEEGVQIHGHNRAINREKIDIDTISEELANKDSRRYRILFTLKKMLEIRSSIKAMSHLAEQKCLRDSDGLIILKRIWDDEEVIVLVNLTEKTQRVPLYKLIGYHEYDDLLNGIRYTDNIILEAYDFRWLRCKNGVINE